MSSWHVYNSLTGEQKIVANNDLPDFFFAIKDDQLPYTFVWKEELPDWQPLAKVPELMALRKKVPKPPARGMRAPVLPDDLKLEETPKKIEQLPSPVASKAETPATPLTIEPAQILTPLVREETNGGAPTETNPGTNGGAERRKSERLSTQLNVIITIDNTVIRTMTTDISKTGISFEDPIPESMLKRPLQIYISSPDSRQKLKMEVVLVGDTKNARRFKFRDLSSQQSEQIAALVESVRLLNTITKAS